MNNQKRRNEKDLSEKILMDYNDVFADIVNVLLFHGEPVINENDLAEVSVNSAWHFGNQLSPQYRDVVKTWKSAGVTICMFGIENQNEIDPDLLFRCISYDGSAYRDQIKHSAIRYPVITIVLYFGKPRWNKPRALYEALKIPEQLKPFVNDYKMNLFELRHLDEETVNRLKSDFGSVLKQIQHMEDPSYVPEERKLDHFEEVADIMTAFGGITITDTVKSELKGGTVTMRSLLSEEERNRLLAEGREEGREETWAKCVLSVMRSNNQPADEAMRLLEIPEERYEAVKRKIAKLS